MSSGILETIQSFMEAGGQVLWLILFTTLALWTLILERFIFLKFSYPKTVSEISEKWNSRTEHSSWQAHKIREMWISLASMELRQFIPMIKTLVAVCPLLGLLGTVSGMIAVFDVMAVTGTSNARLMASGISMATIPTMAGMVAALSGLYFGSLLEKRAQVEREKLHETLVFCES